MFNSLSTTNLSVNERRQGVQHVGKAISQLIVKLQLNSKLKR
nr:MAG TPA: hypothetical protein [Caudoviricetes sp.]